MAPYNQKRQRLVARAMQLWHIHAESYRTNPLRYQMMLRAKRELGIQPLNPIRKSVLKEYPDIPFFRIYDEQLAEEALRKMSDGKISCLIISIEYAVEYDHAYRTVYNRVMEYNYELNHRDERKMEFGADPDSCSSRGKRSGGCRAQLGES